MYGGVTALRRGRSRAYFLGYGRTPTPNHFPKQVVCATGTQGPPPRHSPGWLGGTLRAGPGPLIDPHGAHAGPGPTPPIPPLGHPTRHPLLVIWLRKRRLAGHPKNVLKNAAPRFDLPAKSGVAYRLTLGARVRFSS